MAVFAKVVELGSFSAAARALRVTTSAISQQVRQLESSVGTALLHRTTRKLSLTAAGQVFYEECSELVRTAERARLRVAELRDELTGELRISAPVYFGNRYVIPAMHSFLKRHPKLSVRFEIADERIDLVENRIDIAIRVGQMEDSSLVARRLTTMQEVLCAAPSYLVASGEPRHPDELANHEWIILSLLGEPQFLRLRDFSGNERRVRLRGRLVTNNGLTLLHLALGGLGLARVMLADAAPHLRSGALVQLLPYWQAPEIGAYAITQRRDMQPASVIRCLEHLQEYFGRQADEARAARP